MRICHHCLFIGGCRMSDAHYYTMFCEISGKCKIFISLSCHCEIYNMTFCRCLISLKLFNSRLYDILLRLCSLIDHIKIWSLKMNTKDFCTLIAVFHNLCNVCHCFCEYFFALCYGCCEKTGNSF